jgi:hypothetical protein
MQSLEDFIRGVILNGLPFHVDIHINKLPLSQETTIETRMRYKSLNYFSSFRLSDAERMDYPHIVHLKAKALRNHLERTYAHLIADDFTFDVEEDIDAVVRDVVTELQKGA